MVRAIQTAVHIFKTHPNKAQLRFVVVPLVKEGLNTGNDKCGTLQRMRKIVDPLIAEHGLHFDFSLVHVFGQSDLVQLKVTADLERLQELYAAVDPADKCDDRGYSHHLLKITYDRFPYRMEGPYEMYVRGKYSPKTYPISS
jgi:hypothetical protein